MNIQSYKKEIILSIAALIWTLFVASNVDQTLGIIYHDFLIIGIVLLILAVLMFHDKFIITFQQQPGGTLKAFFIQGVGGWIALILVSVVVVNIINPGTGNIGSVLKLMGATTPALANSKWANWLTFTFAVPYAETQLWGRMYEFFADVFKIDINKYRWGIKTVLLMLILSIGFAIFHLTAKGVTNLPALAIVFVMMFISLILITIYQETRGAVYMHVIANGIASWIALFSTGTLQV